MDGQRVIQILFVDEGYNNLFLMFSILRNLHFSSELIPLGNIKCAINYLKGNNNKIPDIILLNSPEALKEKDHLMCFLRSDAKLRKIPVHLLDDINNVNVIIEKSVRKNQVLTNCWEDIYFRRVKQIVEKAWEERT